MAFWLYLLFVHLIGAFIFLIYDIKSGKFKESVTREIDSSPSEIVFIDLCLWEIALPFVVFGWLDDTINKLFEKKYSEDT